MDRIVYNNVKKLLEKEYVVKEKKSAIRLISKDQIDFHIDIVPGRYTDEKKSDAFLYQTLGEKERLQTNPERHIEYVKNSELTDAIKLIKYWNIKYNLGIKTFVLELLVIEVLKDFKDSNGLDVCLKNFWKIIKDDIEDIILPVL